MASQTRDILTCLLSPPELIAYSAHILPDLELCVRDSNPEMRGYGATAMTAFLRGMAPDHLQEKLSTLNEDIAKLQQGMVSEDEGLRGKAEQKLRDLIAQVSVPFMLATQPLASHTSPTQDLRTLADPPPRTHYLSVSQCSGEATKQHQSEEEIAADLARLQLEKERKEAEEAEERRVAEEKRQAAENVEVADMSEIAQREAAAAAHAIEMAEKKRLQEIEDKKLAAIAAEEEKQRQKKKFLADQAKAMAKHKAAKKKK